MVLYNVGDRVAQPQYGTGTVTAANEYHTTIEFDEHGPRTFVTSKVKLEASATPAPAKAVKKSRKKAAPKKAAVAEPVIDETLSADGDESHTDEGHADDGEGHDERGLDEISASDE
ncbi:MAG: hypothetical protein AB7G23_12425 [Vicinamibacterales bacterium]